MAVDISRVPIVGYSERVSPECLEMLCTEAELMQSPQMQSWMDVASAALDVAVLGDGR